MHEILFELPKQLPAHIISDLIVSLLIALCVPAGKRLINHLKTVNNLAAITERIQVFERFNSDDALESISKMAQRLLMSIFFFAGTVATASPFLIWFIVGLAKAIVASTAAAVGHPLPPITMPSQALVTMSAMITGGLGGFSLASMSSAYGWAKTLSKTHRDKILLAQLKKRKLQLEAKEKIKSLSATAP